MGREQDEESESQESFFSDMEQLSQSSSHASRLSSTKSLDANEVLAVHNKEAVNTDLAALGVSPVSTNKLKEKDYPNLKVKEVSDTVRSKLKITEPDREEFSDIIKEMKEACHNATKCEKYQILTLLPRDWSIRKMQT